MMTMKTLTHQCEGCGEWMIAEEAMLHYRIVGYNKYGEPLREQCGPVKCMVCSDTGSFITYDGVLTLPCPCCSKDN
jgi:hypothetical protein